MPKVFLSYRRVEGKYLVPPVHGELSRRLGKRNVFADSHSLNPGEKYADSIKEALDRSDFVFVLIGTQWLGERDDGTRRIDDPSDWVRLEVERSLERKKRIVPILMDGVEMLSLEDLPSSIRGLLDHELGRLRSGFDFPNDLNRLCDVVGIQKNTRVKRALLITGLALGLAGISLFGVWRSRPGTDEAFLATATETLLPDTPLTGRALSTEEVGTKETSIAEPSLDTETQQDEIALPPEKPPSDRKVQSVEDQENLQITQGSTGETTDVAPVMSTGRAPWSEGLPGGKSKRSPVDGQLYVWIPAGSAPLGCSPGDQFCEPDEFPSQVHTFENGFWIGRSEVTVKAYGDVLGRYEMPPAPSFNQDWSDPGQPIVSVTPDQAQRYCSLVGGRLPTEEQWEYAARAGNNRSLPKDLLLSAWFNENARGSAHPVGQRNSNSFGLYDMLGNAAEWVAVTTATPTGYAVLRGGSWKSEAKWTRYSFRLSMPLDRSSDFEGFRCVIEVPEASS